MSYEAGGVFAPYDPAVIISRRYIIRVVDADEEESAAAELLNQRKYIVYGIDTVRGEIAEIKQEFPYNIKATLEDPEKVTEIQERLKQAIDDYKALYKSYRDDFEKLMKENESE